MVASTVRRYWIEFVVLAAAMGYVVLFDCSPRMGGDTPQYQKVAQDLSDGDLDELHFRTIGYPIYLLLTGSADQLSTFTSAIQLLLYTLTVYLLVRLAREAGLQTSVLIVLMGILLLPPFVERSRLVLSEGLAVFFLVAGYWMLRRLDSPWPSVFSAGVLWGVLAAIHPAYQALPLVAASLVMRKRSIPYGILLLLGSFLIIGSVCAINLAHFGYPGLAPGAGYHLSTRTARFIEEMPDSDLRTTLLRHRDAALVGGESHTAYSFVWDVHHELVAGGRMSLRDLDRELVSANVNLILKNPLQFAEEVGCSAWTLWFPNMLGAVDPSKSRMLAAMWLAGHVVLCSLFLFQIVTILGTRWTHGLTTFTPSVLFIYDLGLMLIAYVTAIGAMFSIGDPRYRSPVDGVIVMVTVIGICYYWRERRSRHGIVFKLS